MAARYWVGGNANWDNTAGTKWATTSGGAGGAAIPTSADDVFFDAASGTNTITISAAATCKSINGTGATATLSGSSTLAISGDLNIGGLTVTYTGIATLSVTCNLISNGKTWTGGLTFSGTSQTYTLADNWTVNGTFSVGNSIVNGSIINLVGNLSVTAHMTSRGTTVINFAGTSTWTGNVYLRNSITVNGNLTLSSGGVGLRDNVSFTYVSGTFNATTSVLTVNDNVTFNNVSTITFYRFDFGATTQTTTLNSDLYVSFQVTIGNALNTINGNNIYLSGSLSVLNTCQGTTNIIMNGTGAWSGAALVRNNLTINTAGTITISGTVAFNTGTLTYTAGTVVTTSSTLNIYASTTLNTNGITWNNITISNGTVTLNSLLTVSSNLTVGSSGAVTFSGTAGFNCGSFICVTAGRTITLKNGITYTVNNSLTLTGTVGSRITLQSSTTSSAFFNLNPAATRSVTNTNATWIDSSGGKTIWTSAGTLSNTVNWNIGTGASGMYKFFFG